MSVQDMIKKSVLESGMFSQYDIPKILAALAVALILGSVIYLVYQKFYVGVIFSRSFAGMYALTLLTAVIIILMITLFYHKQQNGRIYIAVIHYQGTQAGDEIIRCFGKRKYFVKSKTMRNEKTEMAVEIYCRQNDMEFMEKIRDIGGVEDVTLIQYNGEYHG